METMDDALGFEALEAPLLEERPWAAFAACAEHPEVSFFPQNRAEERAALAICQTCPVQPDCLAHAVETKERFGVWGGTSERERRRMKLAG